MTTTDDLTKRIARILNDEGWTFEGVHEPGEYDECEDCRRVVDPIAARIAGEVAAHDARIRRDAALTLAEHFSAEAIDQARQGNPDGADFYRAVTTEIENQIPEETP